jgi:ASC-1-like (ASCH) protein
MIAKFGRGCIIPDAKNDEQAIDVYHRFYSLEDEKKY